MQPEQPITLESFGHLRITDTTDIPKPIPVITINDEIICTECNMTTISGASKSGKSAFTSIIMAGAISDDGDIDGLEGLKVKPNKEGKAVIHFDTEQAKHKHQYNLKSTLRRAAFATCPDYFLSYNIRALAIETYQETTLKICDTANVEFKGIHLIVIDGIADYIADVNETIPANAIVKFFEDLAIKYNCPLITVMHTNPNSDKERGHLGSQCQRKSESLLSIQTKDGISFMEAKLLRMASPTDVPQLQFVYSKDKGYHVGMGVKPSDKEIKQEKHLADLKDITSALFGCQQSYIYSEAVKEIEEYSGKSNTTAKNILKELLQLTLIVKHDDNRYRIG